MNNKKILVMGVSGCGKSLIGSQLAHQINAAFFDGDDFHPPENVNKMSQGIPLTDEDRQGWLETLNKLFASKGSTVIACSALKPEYRNILRHGLGQLTIVYLKGDFDTIWSRHKSRENHYFNGRRMLDSQFETLIEPNVNEALHIDIRQPAAQVLSDILSKLNNQTGT